MMRSGHAVPGSHISSTKAGCAVPRESHPQYVERVSSMKRGCELRGRGNFHMS